MQCFPNVEDFSLWSQRDKLPHILGYTYCGVLRFAVMADLVKDLIANPIINHGLSKIGSHNILQPERRRAVFMESAASFACNEVGMARA